MIPSHKPISSDVVQVITAETWLRFFDLVRETRQVQRDYRLTMDVRLRRRAEQLQDQLDVTIERFAGVLYAAAVEVEATSTEGGAT